MLSKACYHPKTFPVIKIYQHDYVCRPIRSFCSCLSCFIFFMFFYVLLNVCVVVFYQWHFIDLFSCIAASLFNKLTYLLTYCFWWEIGVILHQDCRFADYHQDKTRQDYFEPPCVEHSTFSYLANTSIPFARWRYFNLHAPWWSCLQCYSCVSCNLYTLQLCACTPL